MSSIKLVGSTSGEITISAPAVAGTNTLTLPAHSGTIMVDGPAFSAYQSSAHSFTANTWTKIQLQTEEFDTDSCFDNATNYRFTPTVAGYYVFTGRLQPGSAATTVQISFYKNGSSYKKSTTIVGPYGEASVGTCLIYLNGTTDYVELYGWFGSTQNSYAIQDSTWFQGSLVRAA